jgi:hypothetical protein
MLRKEFIPDEATLRWNLPAWTLYMSLVDIEPWPSMGSFQVPPHWIKLIMATTTSSFTVSCARPMLQTLFLLDRRDSGGCEDAARSSDGRHAFYLLLSHSLAPLPFVLTTPW